MGINLCSECLRKQQKIDALLEENQRLKQKLKYQERKEKEGFFGSSTSSAKLPVKAHSAKAGAGKRKAPSKGIKG
jgi:cell shape-determining protein MreC